MTAGMPGTRRHLSDVSERSFGELFGEVSQDLSALMRQELALAQAELRQEAARASRTGGLFAGSGVAGHMALVFLSIALWWGLSNVMDGGWAALIVAVIWLIAAVALYAAGRSSMTRMRGMPRTVETVKQIPSALHPDGGTQR